MAKFNRPGAKPATGSSPLRAASTAPDTTNYHGAAGYSRDAKAELFMLAVANMVNQDTFYEKAGDRDNRYVELVRQVTVDDPAWSSKFLSWLRDGANMRSASLVGGLEAAKAMRDAGIPGSRQVVANALLRADEPGEALAYWTSRYGRAIPKPVKRGIADAVRRLYTEYAVLKYDTDSHGYRFGDVINLVHPAPATPHQGYLFDHVLERRYNRDPDWGRDSRKAAALQMLMLNWSLRLAVADGTWSLDRLDPNTLKAAGVTWESALSMAGKDADKKALWEALIPGMGYMAQLRNLRNYDEAGVSDDVAEQVAKRLADPVQVAKSRQFPFRFYAAYLATMNSLRWNYALEKALQASLTNVPALRGRTLVLVDQSPSMFPGDWWGYRPQRSDMSNADMAKLFGSALALRAEQADLVGYGGVTQVIDFRPGDSVLATMQKFRQISYTDTFGAVAREYRGHDRVVIVTDEQHQTGRFPSIDAALLAAERRGRTPADVPVHLWNIGGYGTDSIGSGPNRNSFAGMTDAAFAMIPLIEAGKNADWPWEQAV